MVVAPEGGGLAGLYAGSPEEAWAAAADLSARVHVRYVEKPFRRVLSVMPESYEDIWAAAKGMYKLEPAVADGGEVVIYAPHITEFSHSHSRELTESSAPQEAAATPAAAITRNSLRLNRFRIVRFIPLTP